MPTLVCGIYSTYTIHKCNHVLNTHVLIKQESVLAIISVALQIHISAETALIVLKIIWAGALSQQTECSYIRRHNTMVEMVRDKISSENITQWGVLQ